MAHSNFRSFLQARNSMKVPCARGVLFEGVAGGGGRRGVSCYQPRAKQCDRPMWRTPFHRQPLNRLSPGLLPRSPCRRPLSETCRTACPRHTALLESTSTSTHLINATSSIQRWATEPPICGMKKSHSTFTCSQLYNAGHHLLPRHAWQEGNRRLLWRPGGLQSLQGSILWRPTNRSRCLDALSTNATQPQRRPSRTTGRDIISLLQFAHYEATVG